MPDPNPYQSPEKRGAAGQKRPLLAFALSFFLPGAGLCYLGMWKWGLVNLVAVLILGAVAVSVLDEATLDSYRRYIAIACSSGSAALAMHLTEQRNKRLQEQARPPATQS
jgi:hypothetical protein